MSGHLSVLREIDVLSRIVSRAARRRRILASSEENNSVPRLNDTVSTLLQCFVQFANTAGDTHPMVVPFRQALRSFFGLFFHRFTSFFVCGSTLETRPNSLSVRPLASSALPPRSAGSRSRRAPSASVFPASARQHTVRATLTRGSPAEILHTPARMPGALPGGLGPIRAESARAPVSDVPSVPRDRACHNQPDLPVGPLTSSVFSPWHRKGMERDPRGFAVLHHF